MSTFKLNEKEIIGSVNELKIITKEGYERFNPELLSLGNLDTKSNVTSAITAFFDLEGFTNFSKQVDPDLSIPIFLNRYLNWFFDEVRNETTNEKESKKSKEGIVIWHSFPLLIKFLGDGLLVIWEIEDMNDVLQSNIILSCLEICKKYSNDFLPNIRKKVSDPPEKLRCGIAKGSIYSVGNGIDFVGPSINLAARLQKLPGLSFAFSGRGFNVEDVWDRNMDEWELKNIDIRGMSNTENVYIIKEEYESLSEESKKYYRDI